MKNNVSIKDIAKMAGVSIATVSRVINKSGKVAKETEENILQIMKENNYVPNLLAKGIRTNKVTTVGIVIPDISNEFFSKIAKQIQTLFFAKGYASIICNTSEDDKIEKQCTKVTGITTETVADAPQQTDTAEDVDDVVDASSRDVSVRGGENCYGAGGRYRWG